ncbi:MAG: HNH endonuclease [bacterium]|nr:HNH endonuclease [bacterium]
MGITTHSDMAIQYVESELKLLGILEYRFCIENDCYVCDKNGTVYSVCTRQYSKAGRFIEKYRIQKLQGSKDRYGYLTYRMAVDGVKKHIKAHRLVLNAWTEPHDNYCVNHKDGNKMNNSLDNLEWCTVAENNAHAIRMGLFDPHGVRKFPYSVPLTDWMSIYILHKHCGCSYSQLGRANGCSRESIRNIIKRIDSVMPKEVVYG